MIERFLNLPPQKYTNNNNKNTIAKNHYDPNCKYRSNLQKKSASKDQIRILAHEKKQGTTSSKKKQIR